MTGTASRYVRLWLSLLFLALVLAVTLAWANGWIIFVSDPVNDAADVTRLGKDGVTSRPSLLTPRHFLQAFGGELEGSDGGEFGGHLIFRSQDDSTDLILDGDVRAIVHFNSSAVVITGLDHLDVNSGAIYQVDQKSDGSIHASLLHSLLGAPNDFRWTTSGDLVFDIMVRPDFNHAFYEWPPRQCFVLTKGWELRRRWCALVF